ncbi:Lipid droplet phospholipase 1 like protein [Verticillium longisporum]|nr:Lipid droplet phospholipase 1 like protein [Verticillium longisporum]
MANIAKSLRSQYPSDKLYLLLAKRNSGSFTYDGIERGGERVCAEIEEEIGLIEKRGGSIAKISIVGYSLGGLVARYAVGLLYAKGLLDKLECMTSLRRHQTTPSHHLHPLHRHWLSFPTMRAPTTSMHEDKLSKQHPCRLP